MSFEETQKDKCKIVLDFMRNNLDEDIINEFERNSNVDKWRGKIHYTKLFELWNLCKKDNRRQNHKLKYVCLKNLFKAY